MDATWKKEAWTTKDILVKESNGGAIRYGALVGEAQAAAKDRTMWRNIIIVALCPPGDEEDN